MKRATKSLHYLGVSGLLLLICVSNNLIAQNGVLISGQFSDSTSGMLIPYVSILSHDNTERTKSNAYGFFNFYVKKDSLSIFKVLKEGYQEKQIEVDFIKDTFLLIKLLHFYQLGEVNIIDSTKISGADVRNSGLGNTISIEKLKRIPILLGEKDIVRAIQYLPGVQTSNEASSGIFVRGGSADQNMFLLDDVPVYNINHLFGLVSIFNPDIIKEATLYKGNIPAMFGGKLSSVIDVRSNDGNDKAFKGGFSISPVSSKVYIEGPLMKEKLSYSLAARRSFIDYATPLILKEFTDYDKYYFYDINLKLKWVIGPQDRIYFSVYNGKDAFNNSPSDKGANSNESNLNWKNTGLSVRWNRILSSSVFSNTTLILSNYVFLSDQSELANGLVTYAASYQSSMSTINGKTDIDWLPRDKIRFRVGLGFNKYDVKPGIYEKINDSLSYETKYKYEPIELNLYVESKLDLASFLQLLIGVRSDYFNNDISTTSIQPRVSISINISKNSLFQVGYNRTFQPLHQLTNTYVGLPSELWVPSLENLPPEYANIFFFDSQFYLRHRLNITVASYYKELENIIGYKPGSKFLSLSQDISKNVIPDWTQNVTIGKGRAYGFEFMAEKTIGQLSGWISYTLAWTKHQFSDINFGQEFYPIYDRRHNFSVVANYQLKRRKEKRNNVEFSAAWTFASPNPVSLPAGYVKNVPFYTDSNNIAVIDKLTEYNNYVRIKSFHRLDVSVRFIRAKDYKRTWEIGIYNVYNRANPYYYFLFGQSDPNGAYLTLKQKSYFPILPYISYAIKF